MRAVRRTGGMLSAAVLSIAVALTACSAPPAGQEPAPAVPAPAIDRAAQPLAASLSITDPHGQQVALPKRPERIVCLSGLCDDVLLELGMVPAGTSNPVLLAHPALLGERAATVPVVRGSFGAEDVESIAALQPDLVIGLAGVHDSLRPAVEGFAPLWLTEPANWQESLAYLRNLGSLTGRAEQAVAAEARFRNKLADAVAATRASGQAGRRVVLMYGSAESIGVDTSDSLKGDLLAQLFSYPFPAKGSDAETASNYSVEELLARQPDVALVYSLLFSSEDRALSDQLAANPVWQQVPAVQNRQVHEVHAKLFGSGRGTRSLAAVIDEAMRLVPAS
ncbi:MULTISPECIES: ABC transporter substrate-binding protein [Saccharopolyspora]|uniref:ABC transporter substrate-binding protein n=1 Tax=Saccharopolyspora elongata TaxID=2530387 RepID=A0A4R4YBX6_9PSEU|nr:ABC transporter substrate-binding protein [Saccharopolyspora elongata]TDD42023.1 ABC transporter substrate-binding protein [Saccharopolyspora elongata]